MLSMSDNPKSSWNLLLAAACVVAVAAYVGGFVLAPAPSAKPHLKLRIDPKKTDAEIATNLKQADVACWDGEPNEIGGKMLGKLTTIANTGHVQLSGFRTDKVSFSHGLRVVPALATVEGSLPDVTKFLEAVEKPDSKIAVDMLQIGASEGGPGKVTATVSMLAFAKEAKS